MNALRNGGGELLHLPASSHHVRDVLDRALDAQAANDEQHRLLSNPCTAEVDSLDEHLVALLKEGVCPRRIREMHQLVVAIAESNRHERQLEREIAGAADALASTTRILESGGVVARKPRRQLANELRSPLGVVLEHDQGRPVDAQKLEAAWDELTALMVAAPREQLLSAGMANELGVAKSELLGRLVEQLL